jgi:ribosomal protein L14
MVKQKAGIKESTLLLEQHAAKCATGAQIGDILLGVVKQKWPQRRVQVGTIHHEMHSRSIKHHGAKGSSKQ